MLTSAPAKNRPVRLGIVGCGDALRRRYMPLIQQMNLQGLAEVTLACDHGEAKRAIMARDFGLSEFTLDWREVVASPAVDLVVITTPMQTHGPIALAALQAGKHVMVEKPLAVTLAEAALLVQQARLGPGYLVAAPHVILTPTYRAIARHLRRGDIGPVYLARGRYGWSGPTWGPAFYQAGGGPLFDLGVYTLTSLTGWLGPARRVAAMSNLAQPQRLVNGQWLQAEVDDNYQIMLDFGACLAVVTTGFTMQQYRGPALELYGRDGTLQLLGDDFAPAGYELWQNAAGAWQVFPETNRCWQWTEGLRHLVECLHRGQRPLHTPEHAYHVLEIMIKAQQAARAGRFLDLESGFAPLDFDGLPASA